MRLKRFVSLLTGVFFILNQIVMPSQQALAVENARTVPKIDSIQLLPLEIPTELGRVEESHQGTNGKTIIYIQDAHDSIDAQESIAKIIHHLVDTQDVRTVFTEGYEGLMPNDEYFGFIEDPVTKERVSYFFMDQLRIGGAEFAHINRKKDFDLIGADSIALHLQNIEWYQESSKKKPEIERDLKAIEKYLKQLADTYFPKELKQWMKWNKRLNENQMDLLDYLKRITQIHRNSLNKTSDSTESHYPHLSLLLATENSSDPELLKQVKDIPAKMLFHEINEYEEEFAKTYLTDGRDHNIFEYYRDLGYLKKLNRIEITFEEYDSIRKTLSQLRTQDLAKFILKHTGRSLVLTKSWENNIHHAIKFYEIVEQRDKAVSESLDQFRGDVRVLVFGGFHKENIRTILRDKGYSYHIVTPRIASISERHQKYYRQLMQIDHDNLDFPGLIATAARQWIAQEVVFVNPNRKPLLQSAVRRVLQASQSVQSTELRQAAREMRLWLQEGTDDGSIEFQTDFKRALDTLAVSRSEARIESVLPTEDDFLDDSNPYLDQARQVSANILRHWESIHSKNNHLSEEPIRISSNQVIQIKKPANGDPIRLGVLPATLDPIHLGHLELALRAADEADLHGVVFISPGDIRGYKVKKYSKNHRHTMASQSLEAFSPYLYASSLGLEGDGWGPVTLSMKLFELNPDSSFQLFIISGADSFQSSSRNVQRSLTELNIRWEDYSRVSIVASPRKGFDATKKTGVSMWNDSEGIVRGLTHYFPLQVLSIGTAISSSQLREDSRALILSPRPARKYIAGRNLYLPDVHAVEQVVSPVTAFKAKLNRAIWLSDREQLFEEANHDSSFYGVDIELQSSAGRMLKVNLPWKDDDVAWQQLIEEHLALLAYNLILPDSGDWISIKTSHSDLEEQLQNAITHAFQNTYQSRFARIPGFKREPNVYLHSQTPTKISEKILLPRYQEITDSNVYLGVDVGAFSIKIVAMRNGNVLAEKIIEYSAKDGGANWVNSILQELGQFVEEEHAYPKRVVVSVPGVVKNNQNLNFGFLDMVWNDEDRQAAARLHQALAEKWSDIDFDLINDVKAAAFGLTDTETTEGANVLWDGTGVGRAEIEDGKVLDRSEYTGALLVTHMQPSQPGHAEHVQAYAGAPFMNAEATRLGFEGERNSFSLEVLRSFALTGWSKNPSSRSKSETISVKLMENRVRAIAEHIRAVTRNNGKKKWLLGGGNLEGQFGQSFTEMLHDILQEIEPGNEFELIRVDSPRLAGARGAASFAATLAQGRREARSAVASKPIETWYPLISYEHFRKKQRGDQITHKIVSVDGQAEQAAVRAKEAFESFNEAGDVQIVVMVPMYKRSANLGHVIKNVVRGIQKVQAEHPDKKAVILLTGEEEKASDFAEMEQNARALIAKLADPKRIQFQGVLKKRETKGKGWSLRVGLKFAKTIFPDSEDSRGTFLVIDDDIRNITSDWVPKFLKPLYDGKDLTVSSYSARRYGNDDRPLKDHFVTPFFSAWVGKRLLEAEGEYGVAQGPVMDALLDDSNVWWYDFPEFFFIPKAVELHREIQGVNFSSKDHDDENNPYDRLGGYVQAYFDFTLTSPWLEDTDEFEEVAQHDLTGIRTEDYMNVDPELLLEVFQREYQAAYDAIYKQVLPRSVYSRIQQLAKSKDGYRGGIFTPLQWAKTVFAFLELYRQLPPQKRTQIIPALIPLLKLRVGSFVYEVKSKDLSFSQLREKLDRQTDLFVKERDAFLEREYQKALQRFLTATTDGKKHQALSQLSVSGNRKDMMEITMQMKHTVGGLGQEKISVPKALVRDHSDELIAYLASQLAEKAELVGLVAVDLTVDNETVISRLELKGKLREHFNKNFKINKNHANFGHNITWREGGLRTAQAWQPDYEKVTPLNVKQEIRIGADISSDQIRVVVYDGEEILYERLISTAAIEVSIGQTLNEELQKAAEEFRISKRVLKKHKIHVGVPGLVNPHGEIVDLPQLGQDYPDARQSLEDLKKTFKNLSFENATNLYGLFTAEVLGDDAKEGLFVVTTFRTGLGFSMLRDGELVKAPLEAHLPYSYDLKAPVSRSGLKGDLYTVASPIGLIQTIQSEIANEGKQYDLHGLPIPQAFLKRVKRMKANDITGILNEFIEMLENPSQDVRDYVEKKLKEMGRGIGSLYAKVARNYDVYSISVYRAGWVRSPRVNALIQKGMQDYIQTDAPELEINDFSDHSRDSKVSEDLYGAAGSALLNTTIPYDQIKKPFERTKEVITIVGATGATGQAVLEKALDLGYEVKGFVRNLELARQNLPQDNASLSISAGDLLWNDYLSALVQDTDAVVLAAAATEIEKVASATLEDQAEILAINGFVPDRIARIRQQLQREDRTRLIAVSSAVAYWTGSQLKKEITEDQNPQPPVAAERWIDAAIAEYDARQSDFDRANDLRETLVSWLKEFIERHPIPKTEYSYKLAKLVQERLLSRYSNVIIMRPTTYFGLGDRGLRNRVPPTVRPIVQGRVGRYRSLTTDFVDLRDVTESLLRAVELPKVIKGENDVINIAGGYNYSPEDFRRILFRHLSERERSLFLQVEPYKNIEPPRFNNQRLRNLLGRQTIRLEQGLPEQVQDLRNVEKGIPRSEGRVSNIKTKASVNTETNTFVSMEQALVATADNPGSFFVHRSEVQDPESELYQNLFALGFQTRSHRNTNIVVYGMKATELSKLQWEELRKVGIITMQGDLLRAYQLYGYKQLDGDMKSKRNVYFSTDPVRLKKQLQDVVLPFHGKASDLPAALLLAKSGGQMSGIGEEGGVYSVVGEFLRTQLQEYQASFVVAIAA